MKITWLGQAGLLFETNNRKIVVDPYLSDSVKEIEPQNYRRVPVDESFLKISPDIIVLTHNHLDHTDPETLKHYLGENTNVLVLASGNAWQNVRKIGGSNNYVQFNRGVVWSEENIKFTAVKANHSDNCAIGVIINAEGKNYYITGDTLYDKEIFSDIEEKIDVVFLPVNGKGNNMNMTDGKSFCEKLGAVAVPIHCGLFDNINLGDFKYQRTIIPVIYKEIIFNDF